MLKVKGTEEYIQLLVKNGGRVLLKEADRTFKLTIQTLRSNGQHKNDFRQFEQCLVDLMNIPIRRLLTR